jgi:2-methylcitrate dehydratase PrpD
MKRFPCHGTAQAPLQALEDIRARHPFSGADVAGLEVVTDVEVLHRHNIIHPADPMLAQYSVPFCLALACYRNARDPRSFDQSALGDADIASLCERVRLVAGGHARDTADVTVRLRDGRALSGHVARIKATPDDPPTREDVYEKFSLLTRHRPRPQMDELFTRLQSLEDANDLAWISA